jgi:hypothetical protein
MSPPELPRGRPLDRSAPSTDPTEASLTQATDTADWKRDAYAAILTLAASGEVFCVDDVFDIAGRPPRAYSVSAVLR